MGWSATKSTLVKTENYTTNKHTLLRIILSLSLKEEHDNKFISCVTEKRPEPLPFLAWYNTVQAAHGVWSVPAQLLGGGGGRQHCRAANSPSHSHRSSE